MKVPSPNVVVKLPNGKQNDIYGEVEDACASTTFFATIAKRVGPYLNDANWVSTVNDFGAIDDTSTIYASDPRGQVRRRRHLRPRRVRPDRRGRRRLEARHPRRERLRRA